MRAPLLAVDRQAEVGSCLRGADELGGHPKQRKNSLCGGSMDGFPFGIH